MNYSRFLPAFPTGPYHGLSLRQMLAGQLLAAITSAILARPDIADVEESLALAPDLALRLTDRLYTLLEEVPHEDQ